MHSHWGTSFWRPCSKSHDQWNLGDGHHAFVWDQKHLYACHLDASLCTLSCPGSWAFSVSYHARVVPGLATTLFSSLNTFPLWPYETNFSSSLCTVMTRISIFLPSYRFKQKDVHCYAQLGYFVDILNSGHLKQSSWPATLDWVMPTEDFPLQGYFQLFFPKPERWTPFSSVSQNLGIYTFVI
jgi:hypothetical protein